MVNTDIVAELLAPIMAERDYQLVDVTAGRHGRGTRLQVFVDRAGGITVDECAWVAARLRDRLELHGTPLDDLTLEVSSPGLDRQLKGPADAVLAIGKRVRAWTSEPVADRLEFSGLLHSVDETALNIEIAPGTAITVPWQALTSVRLDPDLWGNGGKQARCRKK